jgi:hypothetical protein
MLLLLLSLVLLALRWLEIKVAAVVAVAVLLHVLIELFMRRSEAMVERTGKGTARVLFLLVVLLPF